MKDSISLETFKSMYDMVMINSKTHTYDITDQVITYIKNLNMLVEEPKMIWLQEGKFILGRKAALASIHTLNFVNEAQRYKFISMLIDYLRIEDIEDVIG